MRSPGNAAAGCALRNVANATTAKNAMNRFIFSPFSYRLDRHRAARIRVHSQKISILRLLTLALSSNEAEREIELNFVRDRAHRPKVRDCPLVGSEDELSRAPLQLTCVVDDPRQTDHRSDRYSGAGGETW